MAIVIDKNMICRTIRAKCRFGVQFAPKNVFLVSTCQKHDMFDVLCKIHFWSITIAILRSVDVIMLKNDLWDHSGEMPFWCTICTKKCFFGQYMPKTRYVRRFVQNPLLVNNYCHSTFG